jgi:predicted TIM-barrel fold metal-dependent hydrolase
MEPALGSSSRRVALKAIGAVVGGGMLGFDLRGVSSAEDVHDEKPFGGIVDAHIHIVSSRASRGAGSVNAPFDMVDQPGGAERLAKMIEEQLKAAGVEQALCMPRIEVTDEDPLGIKATVEQASLIDGAKLFMIGVAHPERFDRLHLQRVEDVLKQGRVKAFKAYLGYMHYEPLSAGYRPYYRLAAKYNIPVIFHTGDTYSRVAKLKFAHPLLIDEVAVDFPATKFVLAHFGNPWIMDAAQVVYKNKNVWADLSGILIGEAEDFARMRSDGVLERTIERVKQGIEYAEAPDRFLFGSDWPLAPIALYRDFVAAMFSAREQKQVFRENAVALFGL